MAEELARPVKRPLLVAFAALVAGTAPTACGGAPTAAEGPDAARPSYAFVPPFRARSCEETGDASPHPPGTTSAAGQAAHAAACARYRALVRDADDTPATVEVLDGLAATCRDGALDACDLGLLVVAICSEQEAPTGAACVHLARVGQLPAPEPTWRDVRVPADRVGCFELLPAPGPHAALLAPGAVFCLSADGLLAVRPPPADRDVIAGRAIDAVDAFRVRVLALRRLVREGLSVRELPLGEVELLAPEPRPDDPTSYDLELARAVHPVLATLRRGPRVKTAYAEMPARRLDAAELARLAPGLDQVPLDATCERARACLEREHAEQVAEGEATGLGWDGAPPEVPASLRACAEVAAPCAR